MAHGELSHGKFDDKRRAVQVKTAVKPEIAGMYRGHEDVTLFLARIDRTPDPLVWKVVTATDRSSTSTFSPVRMPSTTPSAVSVQFSRERQAMTDLERRSAERNLDALVNLNRHLAGKVQRLKDLNYQAPVRRSIEPPIISAIDVYEALSRIQQEVEEACEWARLLQAGEATPAGKAQSHG